MRSLGKPLIKSCHLLSTTQKHSFWSRRVMEGRKNGKTSRLEFIIGRKIYYSLKICCGMRCDSWLSKRNSFLLIWFKGKISFESSCLFLLCFVDIFCWVTSQRDFLNFPCARKRKWSNKDRICSMNFPSWDWKTSKKGLRSVSELLVRKRNNK